MAVPLVFTLGMGCFWALLLGCHAVQGYHISRPVTPDGLTSWLEQHATPDP